MTDEELEKKCGQILDKALSSDSEFLHFLIWVMNERVKKIASKHSIEQDFYWYFEKGEDRYMKYRKKPVIVDAEPYREGLEDKWVLYFSGNYGEYEKVFNTKEECLEYSRNDKGNTESQEDFNFIYEDPVPCIMTLEGRMDIKKTDYIITGVKGERYPCKKDIFEETYELVEQPLNARFKEE